MANTNHGRRSDPPMSARQGALIIRHLERIDTRAKSSARIEKSQGERIIKSLQRIIELLERGQR